MLKKKINLNIPLSDISYHKAIIGFSFKWNQIHILLPYHRLPLTSSLGPLLEEFKTAFEGEVHFVMEGNRYDFTIEITDIKVEKNVIHKFSQLLSRIEDVIKQINSLIEQDNLTFEKVQIILFQKGFQFDDNQVHQILIHLIDNLPPRKIVEKIPFPLSNLQYSTEGIRFYNKETRFDVDKSRLPVEVGPALERIKGSFTGNIIFHIETTYLMRWNQSNCNLHSGQMSREVLEIELPPNIPVIFKIIRNRHIIDAVKSIVAETTISHERIKSVMEDWGLSMKHQEIALELVANIKPWTEEKDIKIPLKEIAYHDDFIIIPIEEHNIRISANKLAFETHRLLETYKHAFDGEIGIHLYQPLHFIWNEEKENLAIEPQKSVKIRLNIDEDTVNRLKKIYWLVVEKGVNIGIDGLLLEQYNFHETKLPTNEEPQNIDQETEDTVTNPSTNTAEQFTKNNTSDIESDTTDHMESQKESEIFDLPVPIEKIPQSEINSNKYNLQSIRVLENMADIMYMTTQDLWFRIGDCLVWQRPGNDSATYLFQWPEEDLVFFVGKIWISELKEIREDRDNTGYITRVNLTPSDNSRWENNLIRALRKTSKK